MKRNPVNNAGWEEIDISGTSPDAADFERTVDTAPNKAKVANQPDEEDFDESTVDTEVEAEPSTEDTDTSEDSSDEDTAEVETTDEDQPKEETTEEKPKPTEKVTRSDKRIKQLINMLKAKDEETAAAVYREAQARMKAEQELEQYRAAFADTYTESVDTKIKAAEARLRKAKMDVDIEAEIEATRDLQDAIVEKRQAATLKGQPKQEGTPRQLTQRDFMGQQKTQAWLQANQDILGSMELRMAVERVAKAVEKEGLEPADDMYYNEINKRVNNLFKEHGVAVRAKSMYSILDEYADSEDTEEAAPAPKTAQPVKAPPAKNPMAASPRMTPAKKGGTLAKASAEDVAFARRLGVSPQDYLKNAMLEDKANKFGYTPVFVPTKKKK